MTENSIKQMYLQINYLDVNIVYLASGAYVWRKAKYFM